MNLVRPSILATALGALAGLGIAADQGALRVTPSAADPKSEVPQGMVFVPGGKARIGLTEEDIKATKNENLTELKVLAMSYPAHEVDIAPFYLDTYEVTNKQWRIFLDATGRKPSSDLLAYWKDGKIPDGHERRPVVYVTQSEALEYCRWAMKRLPTEFEWEYAARGPQGLAFPWGNQFDDPDPRFDANGKRILPKDDPFDPSTLVRGGDRANCGDTSGKREAANVGGFPKSASPVGAHDMAGNVWEWTSSPATGYPGTKPFKFTGIYLKNETISGFFDSNQIVIRGGCFDSKGTAMLSAVRLPVGPGFSLNTVGLRCVRSVRAGTEAVDFAIQTLGPYNFRAAPINPEAMQAMEVTHSDGDGNLTAYEGMVFAPVLNWLDKRDKPTSVAKMAEEAEAKPLPVGVLTLTHDLIVPRVKAGTYVVGWVAPDKAIAKGQKDIAFPAKGWNYPGLEVTHKKSKGKADKAADDEPAEAGDGEEGADDPAKPAAFVEPEGSLPVDRSEHNLVLRDSQSRIVAAMVIGEPKEGGKSGLHSLARENIAADARQKIPATEQYTFNFTVESNKKGVAFSLPLRLEPGLFKSGAKTTPVNSGEK